MEQSSASPRKRWYYLKRIPVSSSIVNDNKHTIPMTKDVVHIGRSRDATYPILDPSISRSHAVFTKNEDNWTVKNLSTNGVYVNHVQIPKDGVQNIQIGNIIQFGPLTKFRFRFGMKEHGRKNEMQPRSSRTLMEGSRGDLKSQQVDLEERLSKSEILREGLLNEKEQIILSMNEERRLLQERFSKEQEELERKLNEGLMAHQHVIEEKEALTQRLQKEACEMQLRLDQEKLSLEQKLRFEEETKSNILKEKEELALRLQSEKEMLEQRLTTERLESERRLAEEREQLQVRLSTLEEQRLCLEQEVREREERLKSKTEEQELLKEEQRREADILKEEREVLLKQLKDVETSLEEKQLLSSTLAVELLEKTEVDKQLETVMKDKEALEERLNDALNKGHQVTDLQNALSLLEAQKLSLEQEVASAELVSAAACKQVVEKVSDVIENELQCPICSELFITAIMLNCSHTFCQFCINSWKKNKKDCPNCRSPIQSETRSIVVDNFIDKIVETLSDDMKTQRKQMIAERTAAVEAQKTAAAAAAAAAAASAAASAAARRGRGRGGRQSRGRGRNNQGRGGAVRRGGGAAAAATTTTYASSSTTAPVLPPAPVPVITLPEPSSHSRASRASGSSPITVESDSHDSSLGSFTDDERDSDSDSSTVSGDPDVYYGGYGRCYTCGRQGHWANGCPDRW